MKMASLKLSKKKNIIFHDQKTYVLETMSIFELSLYKLSEYLRFQLYKIPVEIVRIKRPYKGTAARFLPDRGVLCSAAPGAPFPFVAK